MGDSKEADQKHPIMNYELLRAQFFHVFMGKFYSIFYFFKFEMCTNNSKIFFYMYSNLHG